MPSTENEDSDPRKKQDMANKQIMAPQLCSTILILMISAYSTVADKRVPPPDKTDLIGAWIGFDQDRVIFARIELDTDGTGFFSTTFAKDSPAYLYAVRKWSMDTNELHVSLSPVDKEAEQIYARGVASANLIVLEIGGVNARWKSKITLYGEEDYTEKSARVKDRIATYRMAPAKPPK
jgi:hypothetical protein